jgi:glycosyltransferase involved in cell wall biosynthesis
MKILIVSNFYKPGYKAGGPIQSIYNLSKLMGQSFQIHVITRSNDFGVEKKFDVIENKWINFDNHKVKYISDKDYTLDKILIEYENIKPEIIYLNSLFNTISWKFILHNFFKKLKCKIIIAPRGELDNGALSLKRNKKQIFLKIFKFLIRDNITFHATTENEKENILKYFSSNISVSANVPNIINQKPIKEIKLPNVTNIVFISRISPKKNLIYCIKVLQKLNITGNINFDIIGPKEDEIYYDKVFSLVKMLPDNIKVNYLGEVENDLLKETTKKYHYLFFPTLAENYGHIIYECLSFGIPVVISDQTPWKEDNNGIFVRDLNNQNQFESIIEQLHTLDNEKYKDLSNQAFNYAHQSVDITQLQISYKELFSCKK